jgi:hypothetical protein
VARRLLALVGLSTGQQAEHLQARLRLTGMCTLETLFEIGRMCSNQGHRWAHGLLST